MNATAAYRTRRAALGLPDNTRRNKASHDRTYRDSRPLKPFTGCDGEGAGVDELGRQNYLLFRMGERELFRAGARLETHELLDFICDAPPSAIYVGFAFGYDVTMILRDLPPAQQKRLFAPRSLGPGHSPYVWYKDFDIDYLPRNYLKVRRVKTVRTPDGAEYRVPIKGSQRIIYETFGFFQKSFLKVIKEFGVASPEQVEAIAHNKARRSDFTSIDQEERNYCELECELLAALMEKLREYCYEAEIRPHSWSGAGKLASALHAKHHTLTRDDADALLLPGVRDFANMAYYGGRFEITATGHIEQPIYESDIRSAYPAAMRKLPCLQCGRWREADGKELGKLAPGNIYVSTVKFKADSLKAGQFGRMGAFPVRHKLGHLYWPLEGAGTYWSYEIASAAALGFSVQHRGGWIFERGCEHVPFHWVEELFEYRRSIGSQGPGYPIKLGINSLYGKLAQRKGNGRYHNMIWAGMITAQTRALLNVAIALSPGNTIMVATDAIYSTEPLALDYGDRLGQWEAAELEDLFIVQPGLYWSASRAKKKSRGLSGKFFEEPGRTEGFQDAWRNFGNTSRQLPDGAWPDFPSCSVPVPGFIGLKLAIARNKPELAGTWVQDTRCISFDYRNKRAAHDWRGEHVRTSPKLGGRNVVSLPHRDFLAAGGAEPWEQSRLMLEEQPDYIDLSSPFKD